MPALSSCYFFSPAIKYTADEEAILSRRRLQGAVAGSALGAAVGASAGDRDDRGRNTVLGAAIGGVFGFAVGDDIGKREISEMRDYNSKISKYINGTSSESVSIMDSDAALERAQASIRITQDVQSELQRRNNYVNELKKDASSEKRYQARLISNEMWKLSSMKRTLVSNSEKVISKLPVQYKATLEIKLAKASGTDDFGIASESSITGDDGESEKGEGVRGGRKGESDEGEGIRGGRKSESDEGEGIRGGRKSESDEGEGTRGGRRADLQS